MIHCRPTWMLALPALLSAGCAMRGDVEMLESELRRQEQLQQELTEQLQSAREELRVARTDAESLRAQLASRGQHTLLPEQAETLYKVQAIKFNGMLTSGIDRDGQPGDEALSVMLLPVDAQGDLVKLFGAIELELVDLSLTGDAQRVGRWQFNLEEAREHWHKGFLSAGYLFQLDWQTAPVSTELTLHARLTVPDGRAFNATTQVKVTPQNSAATSPAPLAAQAGRPAKRARGKVTPASFSAKSADRPPADHPTPRRSTRRKPERVAAPQLPVEDQPADEKPADELPAIEQPAAEEPPAKDGLETSDRWTDETLPVIR